jgi:plastocyanin
MMTLRFGTIVTALAATLALGSVACSSSKGSGGGGGTDTNGAGGSGGSAGGSSTEAVNGCDPAKAKDMTSSADVTVKFPVSATEFAYTPACIKIKKGSKVTFAGEFADHPLSGGTVDDQAAMHKDAKSPIKETATGTKATFTFPNAGSFGYFCEFHFSGGMKGAVIVE